MVVGTYRGDTESHEGRLRHEGGVAIFTARCLPQRALIQYHNGPATEITCVACQAIRRAQEGYHPVVTQSSSQH